jgi:hypothetical protein
LQLRPERSFRAWQQLVPELDRRLITGCRFFALDHNGMLKPVVFSDAGFNANIDHTSQIGYILAIVDENNKANVIAYAS